MRRPSSLLRPPRSDHALRALVCVASALLLGSCGSDYELGTTPVSSGGGWQFTENPDAVIDAQAGGATDVPATGVDSGSRTVPDGAAPATDVALADAVLPNADAGTTGPSDTCAALCSAASPCPASVAAGQPCKLAVCIDGCCQLAAAPPDSPCDDESACTANDLCGADGTCAGTPKSCDDGLPCTMDACDAQTGACSHTPVAGTCAIAGACVNAGATAAGKPCQLCDPAANPLVWSAKSGCCAADSDCPAAGVCDAPTCEASTGTCKPGKKIGCCTTDSECNDGDACTTDTCDALTGACKIVPKVCADASKCLQGVCDPLSGACTQKLKSGWCDIGGSCVVEGTAKPGAPCEVCASSAAATAWTVKVGAPCDDGDVCTSSDTCDAQGSCKGAAQKGCCKNHLDCGLLTTACTTATCDMKAHVCIKSTQPNCCDKGACCDPATNKPKAQGTLCGGTVVGTEYQCKGQAIQKRDVYPGCAGFDATTCSAEGQFAYKGPWSGLKTCGDNTVCTQSASGVIPTCKPKEPTGTCVGACGGPAADGTCHCGPSCVTLGTCCKDYSATCACSSGACCDLGQKFLKPKGTACASKTEYRCSSQTIQKRTMSASCSGTSSGCPAGAFGAWANVKTCGAGTSCKVGANKASATCTATSGTCAGKCGGQASSGTCWCDAQCATLGDCCKDYGALCGGAVCGANAVASCKSKCGGQGTGGCWCDAACVTLGDCCKDRAVCCGG